VRPSPIVITSSEERVVIETITGGAGGATDGTLRISAEAFLRLVFGRLDAGTEDGAVLDSATVTLDDLRATFPGL